MGELRKFYSIAKVAFVGRSLVPMGGSDMMEAAGLGKPVLVGPHTENFAEPMKVLTAGRRSLRGFRSEDDLAEHGGGTADRFNQGSRNGPVRAGGDSHEQGGQSGGPWTWCARCLQQQGAREQRDEGHSRP